MKAMNWERAFAALERMTVTQEPNCLGEMGAIYSYLRLSRIPTERESEPGVRCGEQDSRLDRKGHRIEFERGTGAKNRRLVRARRPGVCGVFDRTGQGRLQSLQGPIGRRCDTRRPERHPDETCETA